jgi:hypothetical protein
MILHATFEHEIFATLQNVKCIFKKFLLYISKHRLQHQENVEKISSSHIKSKYVATTKPYLATS